jgi:sulfoxide reductase heme-binding subunit YedZ
MNEIMWAFGRASGIVSLLLFTLVVVLGVVSRSGRPLGGLPRFSVALLHRSTSLIALTFLVLQVGTLMLDPHAKLSLRSSPAGIPSGSGSERLGWIW